MNIQQTRLFIFQGFFPILGFFTVHRCYSLWYIGARQFIYGIATDVKTLVAEKGDSRFSNAHLRGIVKQAVLHEGIHIAKGDIDFPERLLPAITRPAIAALNGTWNAALSVRAMLEWTYDLYPEARRLSQTHGQVERGGNARHSHWCLLDCPVLFAYAWGQTIGWLGSDQLIWLILVDDMRSLLDPPDDDLCPIQVPLLVSSNALQGNDWLPVHHRCTGPWTFS